MSRNSEIRYDSIPLLGCYKYMVIRSIQVVMRSKHPLAVSTRELLPACSSMAASSLLLHRIVCCRIICCIYCHVFAFNLHCWFSGLAEVGTPPYTRIKQNMWIDYCRQLTNVQIKSPKQNTFLWNSWLLTNVENNASSNSSNMKNIKIVNHKFENYPHIYCVIECEA